jgi:hypothetical protein
MDIKDVSYIIDVPMKNIKRWLVVGTERIKGIFVLLINIIK